MSTTPNMGLTLPTPGMDENTWDDKLNASLDVVDAHDHTPGKGALVPVAGLNIDDNLSMNSNRLTQAEGVQLETKVSAETGVLNGNLVQSVAGDLWFTNGSGTAVQITQGPSVTTPVSVAVPPGIVLPYAGSTAPTGYLLCDGSAVSRSTYTDLFAIVGTSFGVGDGSTTFNLPNMNGRVPMGAGTYTDPVSGSLTRTVAQVIGAEKHVLTQNELAAHTHIASTSSEGDHVHLQTVATNPSANPNPGTMRDLTNNTDSVSSTQQTSTAGAHTHTVTVNSTGASAAHNNMQPSLGLNFIIKT